MTNNSKAKGAWVAILAMFFLFAMISFVTNLAAPLGTIWKNNYEWSGMLGNLMNFLAYLFMGIPAGNLLMKIGYKKTALIAMAVGFVGLLLQWFSGIFGAETGLFAVDGQTVTLNFIIYLLGAFLCGFCACMLNTVVNPMLNLLGGGGNRGNQLVQMGGTLNSLQAPAPVRRRRAGGCDYQIDIGGRRGSAALARYGHFRGGIPGDFLRGYPRASHGQERR